MFIETQTTPNPNSLKFLPLQPVMENGTREFHSLEEAEALSPLAADLFRVEGVERVFFGKDFISITKNNDEWTYVKPEILGLIMEHFVEKRPLFYPENENNFNKLQEFFDSKDQDIVTAIKDLLDTRIRPAVAQDGGDIQFHGYENGVVYLYMRGACSGCPSASLTLKQGVENLLRHFIPDIIRVEASEI